MISSEARAIQFMMLGSPGFNPLDAGRKATPLHELMATGFAVPKAFVIPAGVDIERAATQLESAVTSIGGFPVAARSSGHLEDLAGASFAGQYVTHLGIATVEELVSGIESCRQSAKSEQVLTYLRKNGLSEADARVSVLVQKMVDVSVAGVAFSVHPTTGREEHALIECCHGLGERLVSGQTSPTQYVVGLEEGKAIERAAGAENVILSENTLAELSRSVLELQAYFGRPQDIEWALDRGGKLWILQSRPITRVQWRSDIDEFTTADFREGGVSARVCTPLMYSLYRDAVQRSMQQYFVDIKLLPKTAPQQTWIGLFYGRPYWSATAVKTALLRIPGFDEEVFDKDLGIQKQYGDSGPAKTPASLRTILPVIPVALALERCYRRHLRATADYGRQFLSEEERHLKTAGSFSSMPDPGFFTRLGDVLTFQQKTECDYFTTIYNNANFQSDLKKLLAKIAQSTGEEVSPVALMAGLQDISHMKMQRDLLKLVETGRKTGTSGPEWETKISEFLAGNYFHADVELDISTPRWGERPERVRQIVEDILRSGIAPKDPEESSRAQFEQFSAEEQSVITALRRSFWRRLRFQRSFRKQLKLARLYLSRREEMREYSTRAYNLVRRHVLEAGIRLQRQGYLKEAADVFLLHSDELLAIGRGREQHASVLARTHFRKLMYQGFREFEPPGELGRSVTRRIHVDERDGPSGNLVLKGVGCSAGVIKAAVRVIPALEHANTLQQGEILVTRFTDPGWTPVLGLVSGIVTEVGGLLSHAAVIGREYGIPAVLNVPDATHVLKTGQRVEIDGRAGTVRVLAAGQGQ
jgi:phosphohistidine swiveling domain-containing protein